MNGLRIRWKSVIPGLGVLAGIIASPQVAAVLPDKWAHVVLGISAIAAVFAPAVATNKPPSDGSNEYIR
jgi:hypothetical protein